MEESEIQNYFREILKNDDDLSIGIAAIKVLLEMVKRTDFSTILELDSVIQEAVKVMRNIEIPVTAVVSGSELFLRFITLTKLEDKPMEEIKKIMLNRGEVFLNKLLESRKTIAKYAAPFITPSCRILTHSRSRCVLETLKVASKNTFFHVFVTYSYPDKDGERMVRDLEKLGIESTLILDSSVGYIMETIDLIMVGAEGVVESGGIVNRIGTYTMGLCAKELQKPFYVLAESFKFTRLYPLNQRDLPNDYKYPKSASSTGDFSKTHPLVDYTPPLLLTLIFTDLGILTPSAVSDELIKLYL